MTSAKACLADGCPRTTTGGPRCPTHQREWERRRSERFPQRAAYADSTYRTVRRAIRAGMYGPCVDCGTWDELEADHLVPLARGGTNALSNLVVRCRTCNVRKGAGGERR